MLLLVEPQSTLWFGSTVRLDVINMSYFGLWRLWVVDGYSHFFQGFDNLWFLEIKWLQFTSTALIFNINPIIIPHGALISTHLAFFSFIIFGIALWNSVHFLLE